MRCIMEAQRKDRQCAAILPLSKHHHHSTMCMLEDKIKTIIKEAKANQTPIFFP